jgi:hypothetical protein
MRIAYDGKAWASDDGMQNSGNVCSNCFVDLEIRYSVQLSYGRNDFAIQLMSDSRISRMNRDAAHFMTA